MTKPAQQLPFVQVDAFADAPFTGNPAAVMPLDAWLPDDVLQAIAAENNLSETAFTIPDTSGEADYELRWFTPEVEVQLCGHASLASGHVLIAEGAESVRFRTRKAGILEVRRQDEGQGDGYALSLPTYPPVPLPLDDLAAAMGGPVVETHGHERGYLLFVYPDEAAVLALTPDFATLRGMGEFLLIATAPGIATDIVSRVFVPYAGIDEDPVTGSAHCTLVPYWADRLGRTRFTARQASARGGLLDCALEGDRVVLGGRCRTVIEGMFRL
jgi:PhzF family phenazine biosynthesis protein